MSLEAVLVAVLSSVVGGIAGPLFQRAFFGGDKAGNSATIENSQIGEFNQNVIDNSTHSTVVINHHTVHQADRRAHQGPARTYPVDNLTPFYVLTAIVVIVALVTVSRFENQIEFGLLAFACATATFMLSATAWTLAQRARFEDGLLWNLLFTVGGSVIAIWDIILLRRDPLADLHALQRGELALWKLVGIALTAALLCAIILACLKLIAITNFAMNEGSRSWATLVVWAGSIRRAAATVCVLSFISLLFTSNIISSGVGIDRRPPHPYGPLNVPNIHPTSSPATSPTR